MAQREAPAVDQKPPTRWELEAKGREPHVYTDPAQAGAAFYAAAASEWPRLLHYEPEAEPRTVARTTFRVPVEGRPEVLVKEMEAVDHPMDEVVRNGYYAAIERSLQLRIDAIDWEKATPKVSNEPLRLDSKLYDDLQVLAMGRRERAEVAWASFAPEWATAPTFADHWTGQVVALGKWADLNFARDLDHYRYGKPIKQEQAAPAHEPSPSIPSKGHQTMAQRDHTIEEQPRQQPAAPSYNSVPVDRVTFSRKKVDGEYVYAAKAYGVDSKVLREGEGLSPQEVTERFGRRVGFSILEAKGRSGTLGGDDFNLTPEQHLSAARKLPLDDAKQLAEALRQHGDDPVRSMTFARDVAHPDAPVRVVLDGYDGLIAKGRYAPADLQVALGSELHQIMMDPNHVKVGSHCIGPGVVELTESDLDSGREYKHSPEALASLQERLANEVREGAALERWANLELGRANAIEQGGPQPAHESTPPLQIDKKQVDKLTFTRLPGDSGSIEDMNFYVHAYGVSGKQLMSAPGITMTELRQLVGGRNAEAIAKAPTHRGTMEREQLQPKTGIEQTADRVREDQKQRTVNPSEQATVKLDATTAQEAPKPAQAPQAPQQAQGTAAPAPAVDEREALRRQILSELAQRYTVRKSLKGDQEYRPINEPERVVFVDRNTKLTTSSNAPDVARTMVNLARAKGWDTMHLKGSPEFKAHAWVEATFQGVKVTGYEPTDQDRERLAVRMQDQQKNAIHEPQQPEGAEQIKVQAQSTQQQEHAEPARAQVNREAHVQQLMDVLQLAMRDAGVPKEKRIETAHAARERLENMKVLPEIRVFDAQVRNQQLQPRTREQRQQQTQHRSH